MTEYSAEDYVAKVHVVKDDTKPTKRPRTRRPVALRTIVLTATNPVRNLCAYEPSRELVMLQATGNDVVIAPTEAMAQDAYNEATGLPNPDGYLLSHANTAPTPFPTTEQLWATAAAYPALISVAIFTRGG